MKPRNNSKKEPILHPKDEVDNDRSSELFGDSAVEILEEDYEDWLPEDEDPLLNFPVPHDY